MYELSRFCRRGGSKSPPPHQVWIGLTHLMTSSVLNLHNTKILNISGTKWIWQKGKCHSPSLLKAFQISLFQWLNFSFHRHFNRHSARRPHVAHALAPPLTNEFRQVTYQGLLVVNSSFSLFGHRSFNSSAELLNTPPLICMSLNKNSIYCSWLGYPG